MAGAVIGCGAAPGSNPKLAMVGASVAQISAEPGMPGVPILEESNETEVMSTRPSEASFAGFSNNTWKR
jgi:hypothetical protein